MSQNHLPAQHAPPSALLLRQFALRYNDLWGGEYEARKKSKAFWLARMMEVSECMWKGLHAFSMEILQGDISTEWLIYYVDNVINVRNAHHFWKKYD